ncbi:MAG: DNA-binding domain-containing protein [Burkholderiales bacterium]|nr:DNA-binding domain-containing protein [Burkholderiales bacterium]
MLENFARAIRGEGLLPDNQVICPNYSAESAVGVYRNNYRGNLRGALAIAYPVIQKIVGQNFFAMMAKKFIENHPSHSGNLHRYGAAFGDFICALEPGLPYLADVARLEWACHLAYYAQDADPLDLARLAQVVPEQYESLRLPVHPSCGIVKSRYPITAIWHAHQPGMPADFRINLDDGPTIALVSREEDEVRVRALQEADALWLHSIRAGIPLGVATFSTLECYPNFDLQAALLNLLPVLTA